MRAVIGFTLLIGIVIGLLLMALYLWIAGMFGWSWWPYSSYCTSMK